MEIGFIFFMRHIYHFISNLNSMNKIFSNFSINLYDRYNNLTHYFLSYLYIILNII